MKYFKTGQTKKHNVIAILWVIILSAGLFFVGYCEVSALIIPISCIIVGLWIAKHAEKELGGINGDIVGAVIVITEALGYLLLGAVM